MFLQLTRVKACLACAYTRQAAGQASPEVRRAISSPSFWQHVAWDLNYNAVVVQQHAATAAANQTPAEG
jgi:hypothetical protein